MIEAILLSVISSCHYINLTNNSDSLSTINTEVKNLPVCAYARRGKIFEFGEIFGKLLTVGKLFFYRYQAMNDVQRRSNLCRNEE